MSPSKEHHLSLKCGFAADQSDGMLWLEQKGANVTAGISLDSSSDLMFDEEQGSMSLSAAGTFFLSMPATKSQAENLARMLGAEFNFVEKLNPESEAKFQSLMRSNIEELENYRCVDPK
jgi:hypothetical protein